jgi:formate dehydrogenase major subunit
VQLTSRYGKVRVRALITDRVHGKELYMPMNSVESPINRLTSSHTDPVTHTPAYKEASVKLTVLPEIGDNPLPRTNSRWGHPTPQHGVEVERKWQRADYRPPGPQLVQIQPRQGSGNGAQKAAVIRPSDFDGKALDSFHSHLVSTG